jgi:hypothetical protein
MLNLIGIDLFRRVLIALKEGNIDTIREEITAYIAYLLFIWMNIVLKYQRFLFLRKTQ